ncbi:MAG TPA: glycogen synthase GlgA [Spongiibacteraceae bacterium]|nr:glycogen synthase GlgA [Spongiibacteraceae bacterium]
MRVLFATSEAFPLIKTGGLADVSGSLPRALLALGHDVRLIMPAYRSVIDKIPSKATKTIAVITIAEQTATIIETRLPGARLKVWLVACAAYFDRPGDPYHDAQNQPWTDNDARFLLFARVVAQLALDRCALAWRPDIVHCNDWQTGLVPALLSFEANRPATIFTIHNLAYQGLFSYASFAASGLPAALWHYAALEFYDQWSFIKGGLVFADRINTVSPSYAAEIQTAAYGAGMEALLQHRRAALSGILNGIDIDAWNPGTDPHIAQRYNRRTLNMKVHNKLALQEQLGLQKSAATPLLGFVGRLVEQKGVDWLLAILPAILAQGVQLALLGSGAPRYEAALQQLALQNPQSVSINLGYSEALAHRIEAGTDIFLMPSRFEPCGLNQMYSLRYGTLPVVHRVGGLADTVIDAGTQAATAGNGFSFNEPSAVAFEATLARALQIYRQPDAWRLLQLRGMSEDFSWRSSARAYQQLYEDALQARAAQFSA